MTKNLFDDITASPHRQRAELTFKGNIRRSRHGWLRLTPAYSLHLVEDILRDADPVRDVVLDPFSGTGTTPLAATMAGVEAHSVDINPFLVWLGNLKMTRFGKKDAATLRTEGQRIIRAMKRRTSWNGAWTPDIHQIEKWWDAPVLAVLAQLHHYVEKADAARDLMRIAFCKVMIDVSHASFGHQSMSFKKREVAVGELPFSAQEDDSMPVDDICSRFAAALERVADDAQHDNPNAHGQVHLGDSRDLRRALQRDDFTKVITSPPYPNRMSYIRELRPYMYWLGFLSDGRQAGELDWQAIGGTWGCATSNLAKWEPDPALPIPFRKFASIVDRISADHPLLGRYVAKYFEDIKQHVASLDPVLAPGAELYYIVGNSKFYDTMLPVEDIYAALFADVGFEQVAVEKIRKRNSKKELFEFVVKARKPA